MFLDLWVQGGLGYGETPAGAAAAAAAAVAWKGGVVGGLMQDFHGDGKQSLLFTCKYLDVEIGWQGRWLSTLPRGAECLNPPTPCGSGRVDASPQSSKD